MQDRNIKREAENLYNICVQNFLRNLMVKEFCKSVYIAEVMIKSQVCCIF